MSGGVYAFKCEECGQETNDVWRVYAMCVDRTDRVLKEMVGNYCPRCYARLLCNDGLKKFADEREEAGKDELQV